MATVVPLERVLERYFTRHATAAGYLVVKFTPAGRRAYQDRLVLSRHGRGGTRGLGRAMFIEFKRPGETERKLQAHRRIDLVARGFQAVVVASWSEVDSVLELLEARPRRPLRRVK